MVKRGIEQFNSGRFSDAVRSFEEGLKKGNSDVWTYCFLAHSYSALGRHEEAVRRLNSLCAAKAAPAPLLMTLGEILEKMGQRDLAADYLEKAAGREPESVEAHLKLGGIHVRQGRLDKAEKNLRTAVVLDKKGLKGSLLLASVLRMQGKFKMAASRYRASLRINSGSLEARVGLGACLIELLKFLEAQKELRKAILVDASSAPIRLLMGKAFQLGGQPERAFESYEKALRLAPDSFEALFKLGEVCVELGRSEDAEKYLRKAARIKTDSANVRLLLARILEKRGDFEESERLFREAIASAPAAAEAFARWGEFLCGRGRLSEAEEALKKAVGLDGKHGRSRMFLGRVLEKSGRHDEAEQEYRRAQKLSPGEPGVHLSRLLVRKGNSGEAKAQLKRSLRSKDATAQGAKSLADTLMCEGRHGDAIQSLKEAVKRFPHSIDLCMRLAWAYRRAGKTALMRSRLKKLTGMDPGTDGAGRYYRFLSFIALGDIRSAIAQAEEILEGAGTAEDLDYLMRVWGGEFMRLIPEREYGTLLKKLDRTKSPTPWPHLLAGALLGWMGRRRQGLARLERTAGSSLKRYGWMRCASGQIRLHFGWYAPAQEDFIAAHQSTPGAWWALCHLAETRLCLGRTEEALELLDRAEAAAQPLGFLGEARAWSGGILLWIGRYEEALRKLDRSQDAGAAYAPCWRGASLYKLGRKKEALADLNRAVVQNSGDVEALVWRGELFRDTGDLKASLADLDSAIGMSGGIWAHVNRALTRHALGDASGMWEDFEEIPCHVVDMAQRHRLDEKWRAFNEGEALSTLQELLDLARGMRRRDSYLDPLWNQ